MSLTEINRGEETLSPEKVYLVENGQLPGRILSWIRQSLVEVEGEKWQSEANWQHFIQSAQSIWAPFIPDKGLLTMTLPTEQELAGLAEQWSPLVPEDLKGGERMSELIRSAWGIWEKEGELHQYITVDGPMGVGKSELVEALAYGRPFEARYYPERFKDNPHLSLFYEQLRLCSNEENRASDLFDQELKLLQQVQARAQGWFAAIKFIDDLLTFPDLRSSHGLRDTSRGQDAVFNETHFQLRINGQSIASKEEKEAYLADHQLRLRFLPPPPNFPIPVFDFAPFVQVRERIEKARGRNFEQGTPEGYFFNLWKNTSQRMIGVCQRTPAIIVDATLDIRPRKPERSAVVTQTWRAIEEISRRRKNLHQS